MYIKHIRTLENFDLYLQKETGNFFKYEFILSFLKNL